MKQVLLEKNSTASPSGTDSKVFVEGEEIGVYSDIHWESTDAEAVEDHALQKVLKVLSKEVE